MSKRKSSIDKSAAIVENNEILLRLLCSPQFYDEQQGIVNIDVFDLRMLGSNGDIPEEYVSLGRNKYLNSPEEFKKYLLLGNIIKWPPNEPKNKFYGHGSFLCQDAREVHNMIEIHPLLKSKEYHIGLFYAKSENEYYRGPLPKDSNLEILEMLMDLADLLSVQKDTK